MGRTAGRPSGETRRIILRAATTAFRETGGNATLEEITALAGVSKGGLLYHFPGKNDLIVALAEESCERFRRTVTAEIQPEDHQEGRLTRAYIRASLTAVDLTVVAREALELSRWLQAVPDAEAVIEHDARLWDAELADDGLPPAIQTLVVSAADGAGLAALWGSGLTPKQRDDLTHQLETITRSPEMWSALTPGG